MKKSFVMPLLIAFVCFASCSLFNSGPESQSGAFVKDGKQKNVIINGIRTVDTDGNTIFGSGGCMLQVGKYYYWYGEHRYASGNFLGCSCYRSTDLVNWEWRCDIINEQTHPELNPCFMERPKVVYNPKTKKYVLWAHREGIGWNYGVAQYMVAVGDAPDEPFEYVKSGRPFDDPKFNIHDNGYTGSYGEDLNDYSNLPYGYMSRDCTLFVDDDGTGYFASSYRENTMMHIYRLTEDFLDIDTSYVPAENVLNENQAEAPCLFKRGDYYYMISSGTDGWNITPTTWQYATNLQGPWSPVKQFGDTKGGAGGNTGYSDHADRSQPAYVFQMKPTDGREYTDEDCTYVYMGDKWGPAFGGSSTYDSRYTWSIIEFRNPTDLYTAYSDALIPDVKAGKMSYPQYYYVQNEKGQYLNNGTNIYSGQIAQWKGSVETTDNGSTLYRDPYLYQWRFVPTSKGYLISNRWSGLAISASSKESLTSCNLVYKDAEDEYQNWTLEALNSPYYRIKSVANNYYLTTTIKTTHGDTSSINGTNSLWLASYGYYVGWQANEELEGPKDHRDASLYQNWRFIPVNAADNMSMN